MYQLTTEPFGPFTRYILHHDEAGVRMAVAPEMGATLLQLMFNGRELLDGCASPEELANNGAGKSSLLFPFPNRLDSGTYEWEGKQYHFPVNDGMTGNAIHGFVRDLTFEVDRVVLGRNYATIELGCHYSGQFPYYPFPFQFDITYSIYNHGIFRLKAGVRNLHFYDIPVGFGWHPYFKIAPSANETALRLPAVELQNITERMLPTGESTPFTRFSELMALGETELDNAFEVVENASPYEVMLGNNQERLIMRAEKEKFPFFMVFTPGDRQTVALEPMSCNMNAFNNNDHLNVLSPDETWEGIVEFQYLP